MRPKPSGDAVMPSSLTWDESAVIWLQSAAPIAGMSQTQVYLSLEARPAAPPFFFAFAGEFLRSVGIFGIWNLIVLASASKVLQSFFTSALSPARFFISNGSL